MPHTTQHTTHNPLTWSAAFVASTLIAIALSGCSADNTGTNAECADMANYTVADGAQSVVAVFDASKSERDGSWISSDFDTLITQAAGVYSTLSVLWVGGEGETPTWAIDNLPLNSEEFPFDTKHYNEAVERASACVAAKVGAPTSTQPGTDLGTAIQVAADRLAQATGPKRLIVVSDGLSNTGPIDLTGLVATTAVDSTIAKLDSAGYRPDLTGADVVFANLGVTSIGVTDGPAVTWLKNYYGSVCERAGAATCETPVADQGSSGSTGPRAGAPDDPDLSLPAVQFEFSESEVRFEPDSAIITAGADVALTQVAACLRDGSTLTVVGHSASVGDPAGEQSTSDDRAIAVANRILELAGHPVVTVNAFGVGATEPKSSTGQEPEDRRVEVSITGACS